LPRLSKELHGRLSKTEFKSADSDNDGSLDKNQYIAAVSLFGKDSE
jgi:hypothetical protein